MQKNNKKITYRICSVNSGLAYYVISVTSNEKMNIPNAETLAHAYANIEDGIHASAAGLKLDYTVTDTLLDGIRCKKAHLFSKTSSDSTNIFFWLFIADGRTYSISAFVLHGKMDQSKNETDSMIASVRLSTEALAKLPSKAAALGYLIGKIAFICAILALITFRILRRIKNRMLRS
jgi:hypothetical protein